MGGHGALTIALKDPSSWVSVSAFAPICNPTQVPWGQKAFTAYLGSIEAGQAHDATCLLLLLLQQQQQQQDGKPSPPRFDDILIDQGTADEFLHTQLCLNAFQQAAEQVGQKCTIQLREGFDHSYHFIAAFIEDHVAFHGQRLRAK
jgi:S-formylglutathione hydrolase